MTASHILTFAQLPDAGGVERAQGRLVHGWAAAGRRVTLVLGRSGGYDPVPGVEVVELGDAGFLALRALGAITRERAPDVVFCPGNHYTSMALLLRVRLGAGCPPIVAKMSNAPTRGDHGRVVGALHAAWLRSHGRFLDHLVAMTPGTATVAERALGMPGRVSVIPNPPTGRGRGAAAPPPLPPGRFILGVGRLAAQKRWDRLIQAVPRLADARVSLVILGEGGERTRLEALARALGVADRVHLPGHLDDPWPVMARAAVLALASDFEGVPGVLREALSVGTPVVATDASPAVREIVCEPSLGTVVARGDAVALVAALDRWLVHSTARPAPVPQPGADAVARYLDLFDRLVRA
jgi:glycosyltransferase involved in cell wall biosynthesis